MYQSKFRSKLILLFVFISVVQGIIIGLFSYRYAKQLVIGNKQRDMLNQINLVDINLNTQVRHITALIENMAESYVTRAALQEGTKSLPDDLAEEYFHNIQDTLGSTHHLFLMKEEEVVVSQQGYQITWHTDPSDDMKAVYARARQQPHKVMWAGGRNSLFVEQEAAAKRVITITCPVMDGRNAQMLGILVVELDAREFGNMVLRHDNTFPNQYTFIVDQHGRILCSNKNVNAAWIDMLSHRLSRGERYFSFEWDDQPYYVCGQSNGITGWTTFSVLSMDYFQYQTEPLRRFVVFCIFISSLAIFMVITLVTYTMTRPIQRLSQAMKHVQHGDFSTQFHTRRKDEIGMLMDSYDFMVQKITILIREVYEKKIAKQNAEREALEAQINPHFLYNTLDSINWMLIDQGQFEISDVIVDLGELLKYAVKKNNHFVTLREELQYVERYLHIQTIRFEEKLAYHIDISPDMMDWIIPKLILQPIVENAILHGIGPKKEGGVVAIHAEVRDNVLWIEIADDGVGMEQKALEKLKCALDERGTDRIGIDNVDKRLRIHYGEGFRLRIESIPGKGMNVMLRIPRRG